MGKFETDNVSNAQATSSFKILHYPNKNIYTLFGHEIITNNLYICVCSWIAPLSIVT